MTDSKMQLNPNPQEWNNNIEQPMLDGKDILPPSNFECEFREKSFE